MYVLCEIEGVLARASHRKAVSDADAGALIAGDELIFPTSRMLRGLLAPVLKWCLSVVVRKRSRNNQTLAGRDLAIDYDWLHLVPRGVSFETHIKRTLAEHKGDLLIAALVHDPRLRSALADSHGEPAIYE